MRAKLRWINHYIFIAALKTVIKACRKRKKCDGGTYINTLLTDFVLIVPKKTLKWPSEGLFCKVFMTDMMCSSICGTKSHTWQTCICSYICLIPECAAVLKSSHCSDTLAFESLI